MFKTIKTKLKTVNFVQNTACKIKIIFTFVCFSKIIATFACFFCLAELFCNFKNKIKI